MQSARGRHPFGLKHRVKMSEYWHHPPWRQRKWAPRCPHHSSRQKGNQRRNPSTASPSLLCHSFYTGRPSCYLSGRKHVRCYTGIICWTCPQSSHRSDKNSSLLTLQHLPPTYPPFSSMNKTIDAPSALIFPPWSVFCIGGRCIAAPHRAVWRFKTSSCLFRSIMLIYHWKSSSPTSSFV